MGINFNRLRRFAGKRGPNWHVVELGCGPNPEGIADLARKSPKEKFMAMDREKPKLKGKPGNLTLKKVDFQKRLKKFPDNSVVRFLAEFSFGEVPKAEMHERFKHIKRILIANGEFIWLQPYFTTHFLKEILHDAGFIVRSERIPLRELKRMKSQAAREFVEVIKLSSQAKKKPSKAGAAGLAFFKNFFLKGLPAALPDKEAQISVKKKLRRITNYKGLDNFTWPHRIIAVNKK